MIPIYYVNLTGHIKATNSKKVEIITIKELVVKGEPEDVKKSISVKYKFLYKHFGSWKKAKDFNLDLLTIVDVTILESLGYGVVE